MKNAFRTLGTSLAVCALLLSGTMGGASGAEAATTTTAAKAPTVDQVIAKVSAATAKLNNFHLDVTKKQDIQSGAVRISNTNTLKLDVGRLPGFAAKGSVAISLLEKSYDLYANDKEYYMLVDGSELLSDSEETSDGSEESGEVTSSEVVDDDGEAIDLDTQYWITAEKADWETFYSKLQYDPASMLFSVKNYKKSMKVAVVGTQTVMQFTSTDPATAKAIIKLYDQENLWDGGTLLPKSVTWKVFFNTKTWLTEKLTVDLSYALQTDDSKDTYTTKIEAKYSKHNKVGAVTKPAELK